MTITWHSKTLGKIASWWQRIKDLDKPQVEPLRAHTLVRMACQRCGKIVGHYESGKVHGRHKCQGVVSV